MKYYCAHCKTKFEFEEGGYDIDDMCPICGNDDPDYDLIPIPDYETLEQYEKRTGDQVSDYTAVFQYRGNWYRGNAINWRWECKFLVSAKHTEFCKYPTKYIVIADPPVPPPDNWRPE